MDVLNLHELEAVAKSRLAQLAWDYYASGADDERCLRRNEDAFDKVLLHYKVLVDVPQRELATTVFGERIALPIAIWSRLDRRASARRIVGFVVSGSAR